MLTAIKEYLTKNYPHVKIISATMVSPMEVSKNTDIPKLNFYDITFEYNGKKFSKLFHTRKDESIEVQFNEALSRCKISYPLK
ncbi:MAG: hypothetical protein ABI840_10890 [bacterium]